MTICNACGQRHDWMDESACRLISRTLRTNTRVVPTSPSLIDAIGASPSVPGPPSLTEAIRRARGMEAASPFGPPPDAPDMVTALRRLRGADSPPASGTSPDGVPNAPDLGAAIEQTRRSR
jgi:hypothetical protein